MINSKMADNQKDICNNKLKPFCRFTERVVDNILGKGAITEERMKEFRSKVTGLITLISRMEKSMKILRKKADRIPEGKDRDRFITEIKTIENKLCQERQSLLSIAEKFETSTKVLLELYRERVNLKDHVFRLQKEGGKDSLESLQLLEQVVITDKAIKLIEKSVFFV